MPLNEYQEHLKQFLAVYTNRAKRVEDTRIESIALRADIPAIDA